METQPQTTANMEVRLPAKTPTMIILGIFLGWAVAIVGVNFAEVAFGHNVSAIGVGFIALFVGLVYEWPGQGAKNLTSFSAAYLLGLGLTLGYQLKWPTFFLPLLAGLLLFALGIIIRQRIMNTKKSPPA